MEQAIQWMMSKMGKVTYSMLNRNGPSSYDCSSAVYYALKSAGIFPSTIAIGNTDSEFRDLELRGFKQVPADAQGNVSAQRGDIFIWGVRGQSTGAFGHTGIFVNSDDIIHCNYGYNGITVNNHDLIAKYNGYPELTVYRYYGTPTPSGSPTDQEIEIGSTIRFDGTYTADDVQLIGNTWQVRTSQLCKSNFTWDENGIPAGLLVEVDNEGYATDDQELAVGSRYKIPGKFTVTDFGEDNGSWLAQIGFGGLTFWVDVESATEINSTDAGTATPSKKVVQPSVPPTPAPTPTPTPQPTPTPATDYSLENNTLLKWIVALLKKIFNVQ